MVTESLNADGLAAESVSAQRLNTRRSKPAARALRLQQRSLSSCGAVWYIDPNSYSIRADCSDICNSCICSVVADTLYNKALWTECAKIKSKDLHIAQTGPCHSYSRCEVDMGVFCANEIANAPCNAASGTALTSKHAFFTSTKTGSDPSATAVLLSS